MIWKPIPGYSNYMVSDHGTVKRKAFTFTRANGTEYNIVETERAGKFQQQSQTLVVYLSTDNHRPAVLRLKNVVASAHLDNPKRRKHVRCIDGNEHNVHVDNLEWVRK